jgi:hypothetical protein
MFDARTAALARAASQDDTRPGLETVRVEADGTITVTDGHVLFQRRADLSEYQAAGVDVTGLWRADDWRAVKFPKRRLANPPTVTRANGSMTVDFRDGKVPATIRHADKKLAYPNVAAVFPKDATPVLRLYMTRHVLEILVKSVLHEDRDVIQLNIPESSIRRTDRDGNEIIPVVMGTMLATVHDGQSDTTGLVMPARPHDWR